MQVVNNQTGVVEEVAPDQAQAGLRSGAYALQKGQAVPIVDPTTGDIKSVAPEELNSAFRGGGTIAAPELVHQRELLEKHGGLGEAAKTAAEGLASGATFGLSDLAIQKLGGEEWRKNAAERAEFMPAIRTGAELTGAIAPVLLSGGTGAAADVAGAAPTSIVARLGEGVAAGTRGLMGEAAPSLLGKVAQRALPMAAQGAAEGAFYGAGQTISESALGNEELTAEKLLAGAKGGALAGLIGGAAIGTGVELGKYAGEKALKIVGETGLKDFFKSVADNQTIRALGANARDVRNMGGITKSAERMEERVADIADEVRNFKFKDGERLFTGTSTTDKLAEALPRAKAEVGAELGELRDRVYKHLGANPELEFDAAQFANKVKNEVMAPLEASGIPELEGRAKKLGASFKRFFGEAGDESNRAAFKAAETAGISEGAPSWAEFSKARVGNYASHEEAIKAMGSQWKEYKALLQKRGIDVSGVTDAMARENALAMGAANENAVAKMTLKDAVEFRKKLDDNVLFLKSKSGIIIPPEHEAQLLQARNMLEDAIEETTDKAVASIGDPMLQGKYQQLKGTYRNLGDAERIATDASGRAKARNTVGLGDKMAGGAGLVGALAHGVGGIPAMGASLATGAAHHLATTYGNAMAAKTAERIAGLSHAVADIDGKMTAGVRAMLEGAKSAAVKAAVEMPMLNPAARVASNPKERYEQVAGRIAQAASNPAALANHTAEAIGPVAQAAPHVAQAMSAKIQNAVQVIQKKLPPPPSSQATLVPRIRQAPNDSDRAALLRGVRGTDPVQTLKDMKSGRLSKDQVDVFSSVAPKLYEQKKQELLEGYVDLVSKGKDLTYEKRIQLGKFLGRPVEPTMAPRFIGTVQKLYAERAQEKQAQAQTPKRKIDMAGAFKSSSERIGSR